MTWANPVLDLRQALSDGPTDKLVYRKRVFGECNGVNTSFKTFEFRRITSFSTAAIAPLGVWISGVLKDSTAIASDFPASGDFILTAAPLDSDVVEASYYYQWFNDDELSTFLRLASNWLSFGDDFTLVAGGLQSAAINYACYKAYDKLALRWSVMMSDTFLLNDAPVDKMKVIAKQYADAAENFREKAEKDAQFYYSRSAQNFQPLWGVAGGNIPDPTPKR